MAPAEPSRSAEPTFMLKICNFIAYFLFFDKIKKEILIFCRILLLGSGFLWITMLLMKFVRVLILLI